ncbi:MULTISPECIES: HD domain-containing phosphohydrolase [Pseudothermotoga]|uniref:Metal dependent phosphohydrolase n=1 Tax=Pseudothermotoga lettingae (strain ATCC BAA-301 / DSM 14385 / NBRC 107922 / TMO) TaxID=416591 RepID=A8F5H9_PSELT|nr:MULTISPECIES: HD domain-containing phosphohydrolase [Pseudothermotoga]ABV33413.1 metal dependent phosphohydrolase [Pseudothermotoga lettingae TMO]MDK2884416.1 polar amino acid transport system substrate-binding protein [Pseudothermotoga sp.]GLI49673.1 HDIG domain-containing protein [Pseudothermotoga lettingae TMO]HBJ82081.1 HD domain-containing protein [Pseudothermotoga sp.]
MKKLLFIIIFLAIFSCGFSKKIVVATDIDYPPFTYIDQDGKLIGISQQLWTLFSERTGIEVELIPMNWSEALEKAKRSEVDVLDLVFMTQERKEFLNYTIPIYTITSSIYYDRDLPAINNLSDLSPYIVGVKKGDALYEIAKKSSSTVQFKFYDTYAQLAEAIKNSEIEVFLMDDIPAQYYLHRYDLVYEIRKSEPFSSNQLYWAVPKPKSEILQILNEGLNKISPREIDQIINSMIPESPSINPEMVKTISIIALCFAAGFVVFAFISQYLKKIVERSKIELQKRNEELNIYNEELEAQSQEIKAINEELEASLTALEKANQRLMDTYTLINEVFNLEEDEESFLQKAFDLVFDMFPKASAGDVSLFDKGTLRIVKSYGYEKDTINLLKLPVSKLKVPNTAVLIRNLNSLSQEKVLENTYVKVGKMASKPSHTMIVPMKFGSEVLGSISLHIVGGTEVFSEQDLKLVESLTKLIVSFFLVRRYINVREKLHNQTVLALVKALEYYDEYTQGHSQRVAELCKKMAQKLSLPEKQIELAALLHDIGKICVPQNILNKEGYLTDDEFNLVKQHPVKGFELISAVEGMQNVAKIILYHHERYDGKGYPMGLKNDEIPVESQVIFIADSFDAMTTARPYRKVPMSFAEALEEIKRCSSTQFNPKIAEVFIDIIKNDLEVGI